ncbi:MAG: diaminopimelate epimerase [Salinivirgaceae bacterium]|jgi:diaminopimelate epimerase|nr:diaminopimelate epimerase [Salinivirgaceae bacterium]
MLQKFHKYHGTGNDFVMIDFYDEPEYALSGELISKICHRRFGVGADGLIIIRKSDNYDFAMQYFNSDGNEGTMCGNGGRCAVKFAEDCGIISKRTAFSAIDGIHEAHLKNGLVNLKMQDIHKISETPYGLFMDTGSPHVIVHCDDLHSLDAFTRGQTIRNAPEFAPNGVNVNFFAVQNNRVLLKTFERGVENITWSCGTGSVATAIAAYKMGLVKHSKDIIVESQGGTLTVEFEYTSKIRNVWLKGPAIKVFEGKTFKG